MHPNIHLYVERDYDAMSKKAAKLFAEVLREKPNGVFGFATGGTPVGLYKTLINMYNNEGLDFSGITTFNLDEYHPIARENEQSYFSFMRENLFDHINIDQSRVHIPNGMAEDVAAECAAYDESIVAAGGIDLQILGIGHNGHIGFNEPSEFFEANTQYVSLKEMTINNNARFFASADEVPRHAITMGIRTIMMSRVIMLLCSGKAKAEILCDALTGHITPLVPASALQLHPCVAVIADEEAAALF